ncbi:MAG: FecR domain-containing protein [Ekhidna sp.]
MKDQEILKYLTGNTSDTEAKKVENWIIEDEKNAKKFNLLKAQYIASTFDETAKSVHIEKKFSDFLRTIDSAPNSKPSRRLQFLKYAAMISIIFGLGYVYFTDFFNNKPAKLVIPNEAITLNLSDQEVKVIAFRQNAKIVDATGKVLGAQSGNTIVYNENLDATDTTLVYHTLTVPYGKRFKLVLSDGTKAQLNAGSSLKYPVKFIAGSTRQVFLNGEAFFDVAEDTAHPFIVNANELDIKVLGTQFNVSSYPEDEFIRTVLVEGSVSLSEDAGSAEATRLEPGHQAIWNKEDRSIFIEEIETSVFTSWIDGRIVFRHMPFKNILKKLERHYNVDIVSNNEVLNEETFTASFDIESIEQVLETFNKNYAIGYTIKDNQIIIN